ncbi:alpha/beta fold hydrolase [Vreelandella zhaodongensis]|uniref:Alpha/beta fold hydrolase n=1 Tax=Vreelandella zhaodongensis TaxID=1176240 RepID=A0ABX2SPC8_VREZH|nr:alpha/beta fold hydrolase [Halomonas zhaodongensis]NYS43941.1 alpha/beta fold hydrolase [Halomonas zhaodongensis]
MTESTSVDLHVIDLPAETCSDDQLPLVVIHGLLGSADNWRSHLKVWQRRRRVIAVDLRNHGRSPHVEGMSYTAMSQDVLVALDKLGVERAHILGHSMGGKVAITLACQTPERCASLMVADIAPVAYQHGHDDVFAALERVRAGKPTNRREADALLAEHVDFRPTRLFLATNLVRNEQGEMEVRVGLDEIQRGYETIIGKPDGDRAFDGPTLVLKGADSNYVADDMLPALREVLPKARIVTLKNAGHWLHADQPEAFQQAIDAFIAAQS